MSKSVEIDHESGSLGFGNLQEGLVESISVMVCRRWDCTSVNNRYMSTDYIFSDITGTPIHATARSNIAHHFVDKLKDGEVYLLKNFNVVPNKKEFRILKDSPLMIELHGGTVVRKAADTLEGFVRHPFDIVAFPDLVVTGNKYFVDVIGYILNAGLPIVKGNGKQTVEFFLRNERGQKVGTTLWGQLGDTLIARKKKKPGVYTVILTSMTVKKYEAKMVLSSSTSTVIVDSSDVPLLQSFEAAIRGRDLMVEDEPLGDAPQIAETLSRFLALARQDKTQAVVFRMPLKVTGVRTKNSWFIYVCNSGRCRKGVVRRNGTFWCDGCETAVKFPRPRYRLQLDVEDATAHAVVVLFDEAAEKLLTRTAKSLLEEHDQDEFADDGVLPRVLQDLVGTTHVFQLRLQSFYCFGEFESFTCTDVVLPLEPEGLAEDVSSGSTQEKEANSGEPRQPVTPAKTGSMKLKKPMFESPMNKKNSSTSGDFNVEDLDDSGVESGQDASGAGGKKSGLNVEDSDDDGIKSDHDASNVNIKKRRVLINEDAA